MPSVHDKLPNQRPPDGEEITLKEEVDYELIAEFVDGECILNLRIRPHDDYPEIIPDSPINCRHHDAPTEPSTLDEMPPTFQQQFNDTARIIKNKYNLTEKYRETAICTNCVSEQDYNVFSFTQVFE